MNFQANAQVLSYVQRIHDDILASPRYNRMWGKDYVWWLPHTAVLTRDDIFGEDAIKTFFQVSRQHLIGERAGGTGPAGTRVWDGDLDR